MTKYDFCVFPTASLVFLAHVQTLEVEGQGEHMTLNIRLF